MKGQYLLLHIAITTLDNRLCLFIGKTTVRIYHRATKPLVYNLEFFVNGEYSRECELLLIWTQRAELI